MKLITTIDPVRSIRNSTGQLSFRKLFPHPDLSPYIRYYIMGQCPADGRRYLSVDLLPNNCIELVILHGKNYIITKCAGSGTKLSSYVSGMFDSTFRKSIKVVIRSEVLRWTIVVLTPSGFSLFTGLDANRVSNRIIDLNSYSPGFTGIFPFMLNASPYDLTRKLILDEYFIRIFRENGHRLDPRLELLEYHISRLNGCCSIPHLTDKLCVSYRTLERLFCEKIGLNAQEYFKIDRFMKVFRCLSSHEIFDYSDLIEAGGYFDQAHLIRDFRKITGLTPKQFYNLRGRNIYPDRAVQIRSHKNL